MQEPASNVHIDVLKCKLGKTIQCLFSIYVNYPYNLFANSSLNKIVGFHEDFGDHSRLIQKMKEKPERSRTSVRHKRLLCFNPDKHTRQVQIEEEIDH